MRWGRPKNAFTFQPFPKLCHFSKFKIKEWFIDRPSCSRQYIFHVGQWLPSMQADNKELLFLRGRLTQELTPLQSNQVRNM